MSPNTPLDEQRREAARKAEESFFHTAPYHPASRGSGETSYASSPKKTSGELSETDFYQPGTNPELFDEAFDEPKTPLYDEDEDEDDSLYETDYRSQYDYDYDYDNETEEIEPYDDEPYYDDDEEKSKKPLIFGIIVGVMVLLLAALLLILLTDRSGGGEPSSSSSQETSGSSEAQMQNLTGVISAIDRSGGSFLLYNADVKREFSFITQDPADPAFVGASLSSFQVGDVVRVSYDAAKDNLVREIGAASDVIKLSGVSGVSLAATSVAINEVVYSLDNRLICLYQGQSFDPANISKNTIFDMTACGRHIYTIEVTSASSSLRITNLEDYQGATLTLIPASGESTAFVITTALEPVELPEGSCEIRVEKEGEVLYSGRTFIALNQENVFRLPDIGEDQKSGQVSFRSNVSGNFVITIDGRIYGNTDDITLPYGTYTAQATADGYRVQEVTFEVDQPYKQVEVTFQKIVAKVTVTSEIYGVSLYVDSAYQGELNNSLTVELAPGTYSFTASKSGYQSATQVVTVGQSGEDQSLYFTALTLIDTSFELRIISEIEGAALYIDDQYIGTMSPSITQKLEEGRYTFRGVLEGYKDQVFTVNVDKSGSITFLKDDWVAVESSSEPDSSSESSSESSESAAQVVLTIYPYMDGATLSIPGVVEGVLTSTPLTYYVTDGATYNITLVHDGYTPISRSVTISGDTTVEFTQEDWVALESGGSE